MQHKEIFTKLFQDYNPKPGDALYPLQKALEDAYRRLRISSLQNSELALWKRYMGLKPRARTRWISQKQLIVLNVLVSMKARGIELTPNNFLMQVKTFKPAPVLSLDDPIGEELKYFEVLRLLGKLLGKPIKAQTFEVWARRAGLKNVSKRCYSKKEFEAILLYVDRKNDECGHDARKMRAKTLLGVKGNATQEEIRAAWKQKMKVWHPDTTIKNRKFAERQAKKINAAYELLMRDQEIVSRKDRLLPVT